MSIRSIRSGVALAAILIAGSAYAASRDENLADPIVGVEDAVLADAPNAPPPIHRDHATKVVVHLEVQGGRRAARGRRPIHVLDLRRPCAGQVHPHPRGRRSRNASRQPPRQQDAAQYRPACRQRPRRRRGGVVDRAGSQFGVLVQGAQSGALRLSLRHRAGRHAHRQRNVRHDPGRAEGGAAEGRSRILSHAGRLLHPGRQRRSGAAAVQHGQGHRREAGLCRVQRFGRLDGRRQGLDRESRRDGAPVRRRRRTEPRLVVPCHRPDLRHGLAGGQSRRADAQRADDDDSRRRRGDRPVQDERARHFHHRRSFDRARLQPRRARPAQGRPAKKTSSSIPAR